MSYGNPRGTAIFTSSYRLLVNGNHRKTILGPYALNIVQATPGFIVNHRNSNGETMLCVMYLLLRSNW